MWAAERGRISIQYDNHSGCPRTATTDGNKKKIHNAILHECRMLVRYSKHLARSFVPHFTWQSLHEKALYTKDAAEVFRLIYWNAILLSFFDVQNYIWNMVSPLHSRDAVAVSAVDKAGDSASKRAIWDRKGPALRCIMLVLKRKWYLMRITRFHINLRLFLQNSITYISRCFLKWHFWRIWFSSITFAFLTKKKLSNGWKLTSKIEVKAATTAYFAKLEKSSMQPVLKC